MSHQEHAAPPATEGLIDLLCRFFPGGGELAAFIRGLVLGVAILGLLVALGFMVKGQRGIWPTF